MVDTSMKAIALTQGYEAMVDDDDYPSLVEYNWSARVRSHTVYAQRAALLAEPGDIVLMHRQLLGAPSGILVDHADGNGINNCRYNIRVCSDSQNLQNRRRLRTSSAPYKGIYYEGPSWVARITLESRTTTLGRFRSAVEAAIAYNSAAKRVFGAFARLNDIGEDELQSIDPRRVQTWAVRGPKPLRSWHLVEATDREVVTLHSLVPLCGKKPRRVGWQECFEGKPSEDICPRCSNIAGLHDHQRSNYLRGGD